MDNISIIEALSTKHRLSTEEWEQIIRNKDQSAAEFAAKKAREFAQRCFGNKIYTRGLIEISNFCKNNCYYCGIRRDNKEVKRYRLSKEEILACAKQGYEAGFRTFVLQGGEDGAFTDEVMCDVISALRNGYPDCAITLSLGERSEESYRLMFQAGANRYLLRHETANNEHYCKLHPEEMSLRHRITCLRQLKDIGYQVGCGFMVGSPGQTAQTLAEDMQLITELSPEMVGIGPFIPHHATPFAKERAGSVDMTLYLLSLIRILKPDVLLPATTALGTLDENGRQRGILAGANVVMPNVSPKNTRKKYELYDNKSVTGAESTEGMELLRRQIHAIGYTLATERGDAPNRE